METMKSPLGHISEVNSGESKTSDFIFPVVGGVGTEKMYGHHFVPFFDAPIAYYIIKAHTPHEVLMEMLKGNLYL